MTDRHTDNVSFSEAGSQARLLYLFIFYLCILKHGEIKWKKINYILINNDKINNTLKNFVLVVWPNNAHTR